MNAKQYNELLIFTSGHYLADRLPNDWEEMEEEALYTYCEKHAWEPIDCWDGRFIFETIESAAYATKQFIEGNYETTSTEKESTT